MKINVGINYNTPFGQTVYISGNIPELGNNNEEKAIALNYTSNANWDISLDIKPVESFEYHYLVKEGSRTVRREWGSHSKGQLTPQKTYFLNDTWQDVPHQAFLYTSAFSESFFKQPLDTPALKYSRQTILLIVTCPYIKKHQEVIISGESDYLGNWNTYQALSLQPLAYGKYAIALNAQEINTPLQYKFAIRDKDTQEVVHWEEGQNRTIYPIGKERTGEFVQSYEINYYRNWMNWKAAGVAIPVFSLRSNDSFGIGEFSDLKKMVDWATATGMKVIQVLPVNDTTITRKWTDSYPYSAISIYALHPIYLGLKDFPLKDKKKQETYKKRGEKLNALPVMDYEKVLALKEAYLHDLFKESGEKTLQSKSFKTFYKHNEDWLFPYACFTYFRDKHKTADHSTWEGFDRYSRKELEKAIEKDRRMKEKVEFAYFTQYLLDKQLSAVKQYAHKKGVILKGDIPIGISRNSVEAWIEPHLFNLDTQTGAPPDDFSVFGQNWGFPTYNWDEMSKDGYLWWVKRFRKMADYFDAYRIDHILGFFRIWEIPLNSVQGLLGYFSPALPFTSEEINNRGLFFDEYRMTKPYIHENFLHDFFGEYTQEAIENFLNPVSWQVYELKEFCDTQLKIKTFFEEKEDDKSNRLRAGLYGLCNEVLFVRDKREPNKFHPRITAQYTYSYRDLDDNSKAIYNQLYNHFFYERHNDFWAAQALNKLPTLISSTDMLVCGEDLGMIPECVPHVMQQLQILSLEIQRMPKDPDKKFENLNTIPYMSVCSTSTHDMSPIRMWWHEDPELTQQYYNEILWKNGPAPADCTPGLCWQIIMNHLNSPAMLTILPWQDWMSMNGELRRENPYEERINIPAVPEHYWRYRMHLPLEELIEAEEFNNEIRTMLKNSGR